MALLVAHRLMDLLVALLMPLLVAHMVHHLIVVHMDHVVSTVTTMYLPLEPMEVDQEAGVPFGRLRGFGVMRNGVGLGGWRYKRYKPPLAASGSEAYKHV